MCLECFVANVYVCLFTALARFCVVPLVVERNEWFLVSFCVIFRFQLNLYTTNIWMNKKNNNQKNWLLLTECYYIFVVYIETIFTWCESKSIGELFCLFLRLFECVHFEQQFLTWNFLKKIAWLYDIDIHKQSTNWNYCYQFSSTELCLYLFFNKKKKKPDRQLNEDSQIAKMITKEKSNETFLFVANLF